MAKSLAGLQKNQKNSSFISSMGFQETMKWHATGIYQQPTRPAVIAHRIAGTA